MQQMLLHGCHDVEDLSRYPVSNNIGLSGSGLVFLSVVSNMYSYTTQVTSSWLNKGSYLV